MRKIKNTIICLTIILMLFPSIVYADSMTDTIHNSANLYTNEIYEIKDFDKPLVKSKVASFNSEMDLFFHMEDLIKKALLNGDSEIDISNLNLNINEYPNFKNFVCFSPYLNESIDCSLWYFEQTYVLCKLTNSMSIEETKQYFSQVDTKLAEIKSFITKGMSNEEIALTIHDYMCYSFEYDYDNYLSGTIPESSYKSSGLFMKGTGVCQAYAYGYQYLMGLFNIECHVTRSSEMKHAWNIINIDGSYYHVDCTWDDPVRDRLGQVSHKYFLLSDSAIMDDDHKHNGWDLTKFVCNNKKYDNSYWKNVDSQIISIGNDRYYIKNANIEKIDILTKRTEKLYNLGIWPLWNSSGGYWINSYSGLFYNKGYLYFNTYNEIQRISLTNYSVEKVYSPDISNGYVYGIKNEGKKICYSIKKQDDDIGSTYLAPISLSIQPLAIILDNSSVKLNIGDSLQLKATVVPTDAPTQLKWSVDKENILTVSNDGYIKGKSEGIATVIVSTTNGKVASCQVTVVEKSLPFTDIVPNVWYYNTIKETYSLGLMTGTTSTTFSPDNPMTRGMVATVLYRMAGAPNVAYNNIFDDVNKSDYYAQAVTWAYNNKIISGYSNREFGPNDNVTREQMAVMLCNYARFKGQKVESTRDLSAFKDYKNITSYAIPSMKWVVEKGIMSGTEDKKLNPILNATRAECAKMLLQTYKLYK